MFKPCYCCAVCIVCTLYLSGKCSLYIHPLLSDCVNEVDIVYKGWRHIYISLGVRSERAESMGIIGGSRPHSAYRGWRHRSPHSHSLGVRPLFSYANVPIHLGSLYLLASFASAISEILVIFQNILMKDSWPADLRVK